MLFDSEACNPSGDLTIVLCPVQRARKLNCAVAFDVALEFKGPACLHTGGEAAAPRRSVDVTDVIRANSMTSGANSLSADVLAFLTATVYYSVVPRTPILAQCIALHCLWRRAP